MNEMCKFMIKISIHFSRSNPSYLIFGRDFQTQIFMFIPQFSYFSIEMYLLLYTYFIKNKKKNITEMYVLYNY